MPIYKQTGSNKWTIDITYKKRRIRKSSGETLERKAWKIHEDIMEALKNGTYDIQETTVDFNTLAVEYINEALPLLKAKTQKDYLRYIDYFYQIIGNKNVNDIGKEDIQKIIQFIRQKKLSVSSIRNCLAAISSVFSYGCKIGLISVNPVKDFDKSYIGRSVERIRFLTKNEYTRLLDNCSYELLRKAVILAVETGFRKEELLSLKWEKHQVDFNKKEITLWDTKNKEHRTIPVSPTALKILKELYKNRDCEYAISIRQKRVKDFKRSFKTALKKAVIEDFHWHDLRHTFATWALKGWFTWQKAPFDLYRLQKWLGHKDIKTTQRYAHLETKDLHNLIKY